MMKIRVSAAWLTCLLFMILMEIGKRAADTQAGGSFHAYSYTKTTIKSQVFGTLNGTQFGTHLCIIQIKINHINKHFNELYVESHLLRHKAKNFNVLALKLGATHSLTQL